MSIARATIIFPLHLRASGPKPAPQFTLAATLAHVGNLRLPRLGLRRLPLEEIQ
jgi:hypothetical protein